MFQLGFSQGGNGVSEINDRAKTIIEAVGNLMRSWDAWSADNSVQAIKPSSRLAAALDVSVTTCCYGDVPESCRNICMAMEEIRVAYENYQNGEFQPKTLEPLPVFYNAMRKLNERIAKVDLKTSHRTVIESVQELRRQGLNDEQIAKAYGAFSDRHNRWAGPFFDGAGRVRNDMIEAELKTPKSVISDDFEHPADALRAAEIVEIQKDRQKRFDELEDANKSERSEQVRPKPTKQQVIDYLREGGFPHQLQHDYTITTEEINEIAIEAGIAVHTPDTYEPKPKTEAADASLTGESGEQSQTRGEFDADAAKVRVRALSDEGKTPVDIAAIISREFGHPVNSQRVVAWLRTKPVATTTT